MLASILLIIATASPIVSVNMETNNSPVTLEVPADRAEASPETLQHIETGCGPSFLTRAGLNVFMNVSLVEACNIHDWQYTWGHSEDERKQADDLMLRNMHRIVHSKRDIWHPFRLAWADSYYVAVRTFGWMFFGKCHTTDCKVVKAHILSKKNRSALIAERESKNED